jgi:WD40 repeat protein
LCSGVADNLPAPRGSFRELRFSLDGRFVLAQDDREITVLTLQPFAILFRIPAEHAEVAKFTPDSRQLAFVRPATRVYSKNVLSESAAYVERWSLADQTRAELTELPTLRCATEELSPDGHFLVCDDDEGTLRILEVASGQTVFEQKRFARLFRISEPEPGLRPVLIGDLGFANISFSTDSRFLVVWADIGSTLAWDLRERVALNLKGDLRSLNSKSTLHFAFLTQDSVLITHSWGYHHGVWVCKVVDFPAGKVLSKPKIPVGRFYRSTYPGFVLVRPFGRSDPNIHRTAAANLSTGQVIISDGALDVFGQYYVAELVNGKEVGLYEIGKRLLSTVVIHGK